MNNKPVAWTSQDVLDATHIIKAVVRREQDEQHTIPLYTHPVKEQVETIEYTCPNCQTHVGLHVKHPVKELTDEEIEEVFWDIANQKIDTPVLSFAKAILRKAQEK